MNPVNLTSAFLSVNRSVLQYRGPRDPLSVCKLAPFFRQRLSCSVLNAIIYLCHKFTYWTQLSQNLRR
uniref:Uncharacterized protein n=1 Tax=Sparus aurata TaxID=8175 RepID=A0A671XAU6_SPAAU